MRYVLLLIAAFSLACSGSPRNRSDDAGRDTGPDCSAVGAGRPPLCEVGCTEVCGCGSCAEGAIEDRAGELRVCVGGCFALPTDAGTDAATDAGDASVADSGSSDAGAVDSGTADSGAADSGTADSGTADSGAADSGTAPSGGDTCGEAFDVTAGVVLSSESTMTATDDYSPPLGMGCPSGGAASGRDRAYFVEPMTLTNYRVTVTPAADFDPMLYLVTACDFSAGCVDGTILNGTGTPESLTFSAAAGIRTYIIVDGELGSRGSYELRVELP
ncbi:MAG: hypothetical protein GXP55_08075 [Deltaproteobacteria bacterium]|nr:hypothetical protein [Deltaproteobacteria bacterium]